MIHRDNTVPRPLQFSGNNRGLYRPHFHRRLTLLLGALALLLASCGVIDSGPSARPVKFQLALYQGQATLLGVDELPLPRVEAAVLDCSGGGECDSSTASAIGFDAIDGDDAVRATDARCPVGDLADCKLDFTPEDPSVTVWLPDGSYALEAQAYAEESGNPTEYCQPAEEFAVGAGEDNTVTITLEPCVYTGNFVYVDNTVTESGDGSHVNPFKTIQEALAVVAYGGTVHLAAGEDYELTSAISIGENITLQGETGDGDAATISVDSTLAPALTLAKGATVENLSFDMPGDPTGLVIQIAGDDVTIKDNTFSGTWSEGDTRVSRAMVFQNSVMGFLVEGNTIHGLRQPAYINGGTVDRPTSGVISNNRVYATRGWVVESGAVEFSGNSWRESGTGPSQNIACDIALIPGVLWGDYDVDKLIADNGGTLLNLGSGDDSCDQRPE